MRTTTTPLTVTTFAALLALASLAACTKTAATAGDAGDAAAGAAAGAGATGAGAAGAADAGAVDVQRPDERVTAADQSCSQDSECTLTTADCCGCTSLGKQIGVRADKVEDLAKRRAPICAAVSCAQAMSDDPTCNATKAVCRAGTCVPDVPGAGGAGGDGGAKAGSADAGPATPTAPIP